MATLTSCKLYDPCSKKTYIIIDTGIKDCVSTAKLWDSKYGWLLLSVTPSSDTLFFLYNPFIKERIDFPDSKTISSKYVMVCATFSTHPTS
ncbi:hypothetical protein GIB67_030053, partial [Kingdonia uniflora]